MGGEETKKEVGEEVKKQFLGRKRSSRIHCVRTSGKGLQVSSWSAIHCSANNFIQFLDTVATEKGKQEGIKNCKNQSRSVYDAEIYHSTLGKNSKEGVP